MRKISPPPGFDSRPVQPVASPYTDWDIPAPISSRYQPKVKIYTLCIHCAAVRSINTLSKFLEVTLPRISRSVSFLYGCLHGEHGRVTNCWHTNRKYEHDTIRVELCFYRFYEKHQYLQMLLGKTNNEPKDSKFLECWVWQLLSSEVWRRVVWFINAEVSEQTVAFRTCLRTRRHHIPVDSNLQQDGNTKPYSRRTAG